MRVCVHGGRSRERLEATLKEIADDGGRAEGFLAELERAEDLVEPVTARLPFSVVVLAFGPYLEASLLETGPRDWVRMTELNLALPGVALSLCAPAMQAAGWGRFVLFGGPRTDGIESFKKIAAYGAAKTGVSSLVRSAARQLAGDGITVNAICPGYIRTEYYPEHELERLAGRMPDRELIAADEVAQLVERLVAPESKALNGAVIRIDKGV